MLWAFKHFDCSCHVRTLGQTLDTDATTAQEIPAQSVREKKELVRLYLKVSKAVSLII